MAAQVSASPWQVAPGRLLVALLLALLLHGALIFGLGFSPQQAKSGADSLAESLLAESLEVTLVSRPASQPPREAGLIAASYQLGSDDHDSALPPDSSQTSPVNAAERLPLSPPSTAMPSVLVTHDGASNHHPQGKDISTPLNAGSQNIAGLLARLDLQKQAYRRIPHTLVLTAASAHAAEEADYLYRWIEWVERVGNAHYPEEARRRQLFGDLRLAVTVGRDGAVEQVEILASSGQQILDQAAVRIVRLAAPFAPIPASIRADRIEVIRTWRFMPGEVFAARLE